jgi:hypothetical protein
MTQDGVFYGKFKQRAGEGLDDFTGAARNALRRTQER